MRSSTVQAGADRRPTPPCSPRSTSRAHGFCSTIRDAQACGASFWPRAALCTAARLRRSPRANRVVRWTPTLSARRMPRPCSSKLHPTSTPVRSGSLHPTAPAKGRVIAELIGRVSAGRPVTLRGDGHPRLSPIFVDDVAAIFVRALDPGAAASQRRRGGGASRFATWRRRSGKLSASPRSSRSRRAKAATGRPGSDTTLLRRTFELGR